MSEFTKGKLHVIGGCLHDGTGYLKLQSAFREDAWEGDEEARANAARIAHCWNHCSDYEAALNDISMKVGYITIHGVGKRDATPGLPQPVAIPFEEVWELIQEIGNAANAALSKANPQAK